MRNIKLIACLLTAGFLTACTEPNGAPGRGIENGGALSKADVGTGIGVIGGGLLGSTIGGGAGSVVATIGGGLLGGYLGNQIGTSLDNADRAAYERASQRAMQSGQARNWTNSSTGHHGTIHPRGIYRNADGESCRKYTQTIYIDGKAHQGHGVACRQDDGSWEINE